MVIVKSLSGERSERSVPASRASPEAGFQQRMRQERKLTLYEKTPAMEEAWQRLMAKVKIVGPKGCWIVNNTPWYPSVYVEGRRIGGHRVSYMVNKGPLPKGVYACHDCDFNQCINPDHLFPGTHADNMADAAKKGIIKAAMVGDVNRGENNGRAILTLDQVREIRAVPKRRGYAIALAEKYGVSRFLIYQVRSSLNKIWQE
jgi:hypothetical protein